MIIRHCICGNEFSVAARYKNYILPEFPVIGSTKCLIDYIRAQPYKASTPRTIVSSFLSPPHIYYEPLQKWFRSVFEGVFAQWLNWHKIAYRYEELTLSIHGREYTPDFYLPHNGLFIELKGLWSGGAKAKTIATKAAGTNLLLLPYYFDHYCRQDLYQGEDSEIFKCRL